MRAMERGSLSRRVRSPGRGQGDRHERSLAGDPGSMGTAALKGGRPYMQIGGSKIWAALRVEVKADGRSPFSWPIGGAVLLRGVRWHLSIC